MLVAGKRKTVEKSDPPNLQPLRKRITNLLNLHQLGRNPEFSGGLPSKRKKHGLFGWLHPFLAAIIWMAGNIWKYMNYAVLFSIYMWTLVINGWLKANWGLEDLPKHQPNLPHLEIIRCSEASWNKIVESFNGWKSVKNQEIEWESFKTVEKDFRFILFKVISFFSRERWGF